MERSAHGYWLADAGPVTPQPPLAPGAHNADVVVVGGGFLGLWTSWWLAESGADVVLLESELCGQGPSGRNGGFVNPLWDRAQELRELFGDDGALAVCRASENAIDMIDRWCREQDVDAHLRRAPMLEVATNRWQLGTWDDGVAACHALGAADEVEVLDGDATRALCASPAFLGSVRWRAGATVHPALLALGLRARLIDHPRVRVHERTRVRAMRGPVCETAGGGSISAGAAVLAINHASAGVAPLRESLSVASSHVIATEPVPDVLDELGWRGGEGISDCRTLLHYFRTTRDDRIVFGWGGGRMGFGAHRRPELDNDHAVQDQIVRHMHELLPQTAGCRITHAWGGPIDVSPVHLPWFGSDGPVHYGFGFTGNGVGPTSWGGRLLADLAAGERTALTTLPIVGGLPPKRFPPEPLRFAGGVAIREALIRVDDAQQHGGDGDPLSRGIARLPRMLGLHLPR